ncbi:MAG: hypothetical protein NWS63_01295 [Saprospiraceae bacterium]|nr:hypothetical protein [Saprospiraceae bacterium]
MKAIQDLYATRAEEFANTSLSHRQRYHFFSFVRLIIFILALGMAIVLGTWHWWAGLAFFMVFLAFFYRFVRWHSDIARKQAHAANLADINRKELNALAYHLDDFAFDPPRADVMHPYAADLDIEGAHALFQLLNRASTGIGRAALSDFLCYPADLPEILARQEAIRELSPQVGWRQELQALGKEAADDPAHVAGLRQWLEAPNIFAEIRWLTAARVVIPLWTLVAAIFVAPVIPWTLNLLLLLPAGYILQKTVRLVNQTHELTGKAGTILHHYAAMIAHLESADFRSAALQKAQLPLRSEDKQASEALKTLAYITSQLDVRYNAFAVLLNLGFLWDIQWLYRLEQWKSKYGIHLSEWFDSLKYVEAISSLANAAYNNPDWVFPEIIDACKLEAVHLGHPLIAPGIRVCNDFQLPSSGHIKLITGSNMAGKSTFLRTVGINIVLAMAGAPVCATRFRCPLLMPYTSMRTRDALHENTSSFYAELKRLKFIIEAVEAKGSGGHYPFFILDEILKGTNSEDRHTGSRALIKQLIAAGGTGLIATHDLELGKLEAEYGGALENLCMEVTIEDGKLSFDYKIKKGISKSFNATLLMREMGIRI